MFICNYTEELWNQIKRIHFSVTERNERNFNFAIAKMYVNYIFEIVCQYIYMGTQQWAKRMHTNICKKKNEGSNDFCFKFQFDRTTSLQNWFFSARMQENHHVAIYIMHKLFNLVLSEKTCLLSEMPVLFLYIKPPPSIHIKHTHTLTPYRKKNPA